MGRRVNFTIMTWFSEKRLFLARELTDGSLTLCLPKGKWETGGEVADFKDVHISAHTPREFNGRLCNRVKRSGLATNGDYYESHLIVTDKRKRGFLWPMTSALNGLASGRDFKARASDETIQLIGYTGPEESLCYTIYASDLRIKLPQVQGFSHHRIEFSKLALTIYITFYHRENVGIQIHKEEGNRAILKNGSSLFRMSGRKEIIAPRMAEAGIERYLQRTQSEMMFAFSQMGDLKSDLAEANGPHPGKFSRWPHVTDDIHDEFGVMSRLRNPIYDNPLKVNGVVKRPEERHIRAKSSIFMIDENFIAQIPVENLKKINTTMKLEIRKLAERNTV